MAQWFLRMTEYSDELLDELEQISFPENVKTMQRNWIGRSYGAQIEFSIADSNSKIQVFTTRPDTIFGATFVTLSPEHPLCEELCSGTKWHEGWKNSEMNVQLCPNLKGLIYLKRRMVFFLGDLQLIL